MSSLTLPNTLANGTTADADDVMENFNAVAGALFTIGNANMSADDPVALDKIACKYSTEARVVPLVPYDNDADWSGSAARFTMPSNETTYFVKWQERVAVGQKVFLVAVDVHALDIEASGSDQVVFNVYKNAIQLGGGRATLDTDNEIEELARSTPFANPLCAIEDKDTIQLYLGMIDGGSGAKARGVTATLWFKRSLIE